MFSPEHFPSGLVIRRRNLEMLRMASAIIEPDATKCQLAIRRLVIWLYGHILVAPTSSRPLSTLKVAARSLRHTA